MAVIDETAVGHRRRRASASLVAVWLSLALASCSDDGPEPIVNDDSGGFPPPDTLDAPQLPGFPPMEVPPANPITAQGVELGRRLFYDPILSADSTQACADCHSQPFSFSDHGERFSEGIDGLVGTRNAPVIVNAGWSRRFFWDGRVTSLEAQALEPVRNPIEMHEHWPNAAEKLRRHPDYPGLFGLAFGTSDIDSMRVVMAIAQFERTMVSANAKYDRWLVRAAELTPEEERGFALFFTERGDCFHCHGTNQAFTDHQFHNIGLDSILVDRGRGELTGDPADMGLFKTPTLRNVEFTAPYMHDGRFQTLEEVVQHYNGGGFRTPTVDPLIRVGTGLRLTTEDVQALVAFMETLSDSGYVDNPAYANPFD
jgi:cytochrome c peroxidase